MGYKYNLGIVKFYYKTSKHIKLSTTTYQLNYYI